MAVVLGFAAVSGAGLPLTIIGYLTLLQRRTPQAIMGRASTAAEVVLATPQAISLALGSLLVVVWDYRLIFAVVAVVTALGALHIAFWLRDTHRGGVAPRCRRSAIHGPGSSASRRPRPTNLHP